jgi:hypothetical protein
MPTEPKTKRFSVRITLEDEQRLKALLLAQHRSHPEEPLTRAALGVLLFRRGLDTGERAAAIKSKK